jgi:hypothetical protein
VHADTTAGHDEKNQQHSAGEDRKTKENAAGGDHYEDSLLPDEGVALNDFYAHMPTHGYIFAPSRELWPSE